MQGDDRLSREEIYKEINSGASQIGIPDDYVKYAMKGERDLDWITTYNLEDQYKLIQRVIERAITLEGIFKAATSRGIKEVYVYQSLGYHPKLGKMDKEARDKIIKAALRLQQKKEKGLSSKLILIITISVCALFLGLSFLSSGLTGNAIGSLGNLNTNIIGLIFLFIGLIALLLIPSRKFKNKF